MKILLTGFNAFGTVKVNPSQLIVEHLAANPPEGIDLITEVLPTEFEAAGNRIRALIRQHQPDAILCLGVAQKRDKINLEWVARNLNNAEIADNSGKILSGKKIVEDAPEIYHSTLPITYLYSAMNKKSIPVTVSSDAGAYVCNHVFYSARHEIEQRKLQTPCGFIHVPGIGDQPSELPLDIMVEVIESCLGELLADMTPTIQFVNPKTEPPLLDLYLTLPTRPQGSAIVDVDGLTVAYHGLEIEGELVAVMASATIGFSQQISEILDNGLFRYSLIAGDDGVFLATHIGPDYVLGLNFAELVSMDTLLPILASELPRLQAVLYSELKRSGRD